MDVTFTVDEVEEYVLRVLADASRALRSDAMVYQRAAKERAALARGLPRDAYFALPFAAWEAIRNATAGAGAS